MNALLSDEEFFQFLNLYRNYGNKDALAKLVEANQGLIRFIADKHATTLHNGKYDAGLTSFIDWQDLTQAGNIGLLAAIQRFDPARKHKFATYAYAWIDKHIRLLINSALLIKNARFHFRTVVSSDDRENCSIGELEKLRARSADNKNGVAILGEMLTLLSPEERKVLCLRFGLQDGKEKSLEKVAAILKTDLKNVSNILDSSLEELNQIYALYERTGRIMRMLPTKPSS